MLSLELQVHPDLVTLHTVHEQDQKLEVLHKKMQAAHKSLLAAEAEVKAASQHLGDRQNAVKASRHEELGLHDKVRTYEHQRGMAIRALEQGAGTPEAAERQIEQCGRILDDAETTILQLMEDQERITEEIEAAELALSEVTRILESREREVPTQIAAHRSAYKDQKTLRDDAFGQLDPELQDRYEKLRKRRGSAVSIIKEKACHRCGRVVQPQHLGDILSGQLLPCHGCSRWLFPTA
jgi:predicted  nucleic acid-binding Zn-ribbon protein